MDSLKVYISNIEPRLLHHFTGKMGELIHLIQENNFISEEALIQHFCGKNKDRKYFQNLKSRTLKMLQALAIVSIKKGTGEVKKKLDLCRKNFTLGQKFLGNGDRKEGLRLVKQAYAIAIEYDFVHMACELSSVLFHHHIYYQRSSKLAEVYSKQVEKYVDNYKAEKIAEGYFYKAIFKMSGNPRSEELKKYVDESKATKEKV